MNYDERQQFESFECWLAENTENGVAFIPEYMCTNLLKIISKQNHILFSAGEVLVDESKQHITPETAIKKIRKIFQKI